MSVFGADYSDYYDLFYTDKDYPAEAVFVRDIIQRYQPRAHLMLESRVRQRTTRSGICASRIRGHWGRP